MSTSTSIASWFRGLTRAERKGLLALLHFFRKRLDEDRGAREDYARPTTNFLDLIERMERVHAEATPEGTSTEPVSVPMFCPHCGMSHVERDGFDRIPHHWHRCHLCGREWRLHEYAYGVPPSDDDRPRMLTRLLREVRDDLRATNRRGLAGGDKRAELVRRIEAILFRGTVEAVVAAERRSAAAIDHLDRIERAAETMRQALSGGHVEDEVARRALVSGVATIGDSVSALRKERS